MEAAPKLPRRDFWTIVCSLAGVTALSWLYLLSMAKHSCCLGISVWDAAYFWMMFTMWAIMMVGMMLPSAAPMILIYAAVARKAKKQGMPIASTWAFTLGYLLMWTAFSLLVTMVQWQLDKAALLSSSMVVNSSKLGAGFLIAAGIYQWLPVKDSCLRHCQSPFHFISSHWQAGNLGAFWMGISHGIFCIGCCWVLMLLLFVGGVMNILWIALITVFVLLEKLLLLGGKSVKITGALMMITGAVMLTH